MALHLVRHGLAGAQRTWKGDDELRPLTPAGRRQATVLVDELTAHPVTLVLSSRFRRCVETVEPTATALGLPVDEHDGLAEEASVEQTWTLLEMLAIAGTEAVLCSHANVLGAVLDRAHRRGVEVVAADWSSREGCVWRLEADDGGTFCRAVLATTPT